MRTAFFASREPRVFHPRSHARATLTAFLTILHRDLVVAWQEVITFLIQTLIQPLFFLFIFGKVLPSIGMAGAGFAVILLPGIVAFTVFLTAWQSMAVGLSVDLGFLHEIDDRLLAPLPVWLVAVEKVCFAALRALLAGAVIFPLALWILGSSYQVRTDLLGVLIGLMGLVALSGAALGLVLGTVTPAELIQLTYVLTITPLIFTGCIYYPWALLNSIKWFQVITLFNPLTYASEGLRYAMLPPLHGQAPQTLAIGWVLLALCMSFALCLWGGIKLFHRRVVS
jgi:ABC-2 type transport system permease protein